MAPVVVLLVVDDLLHGVAHVLGRFGRAARDDAGVHHPAGHLRQPVADIWDKSTDADAEPTTRRPSLT